MRCDGRGQVPDGGWVPGASVPPPSTGRGCRQRSARRVKSGELHALREAFQKYGIEIAP